MKKLLSLLLAAALLGALGAPALAAEESTDARLARVTQAVKQSLGLDTSGYEDFQGDCYDGELAPVWSLRWSSGDRYVHVEAMEDGTVTGYNCSNEETDAWGAFPTFPKGDAAADRAAAETFLAKVLRKGEDAAFEKDEELESLNDSGRRYSGGILLNGLPSPLSFNVTVRNGQVARYWRTDPNNSFVGSIPSPETSVVKAGAAEKLKGTLELRLEYVKTDDKSEQAVLRYVPEDGHNYYVDGVSGELVDLTELEEAMNRKYANTAGGDSGAAAPKAMAEDAAAESGFSEAEQSGIQQMEGVLPKETLDKSIRAVAAYGLKGYALASASYSVGEKDGEGKAEVLCVLRYEKTGEKTNLSRMVTVDARTGDVRGVQSYAPWREEEPSLTLEEAQAKAEAFLKDFCPERLDAIELYDSSIPEPFGRDGNPPYYTFVFARKANGYFFPENKYQVFIDVSDGSIYQLSYEWDEDISFGSTEGVVSGQTALDAWMGTYEVTLGYNQVPQALTGGGAVSKRLIGLGETHAYGLRLGYYLERDGQYLGVDAKSGEPLEQEIYGRTVKTYDDLAGSPAKEAVETLARYGVGYDSASFRPGKSLTQWDLVCLLYSTDGGMLNPEEADKQKRDGAYSAIYRMGALERGERDDSAVLNRGQAVEMLLDAAGYGGAARLKGIFTCTYSDRDHIPEEGLGYAAIAQALGLASGTYAASGGINRGEAAGMLCTLLGR